MNRYSTFSTKKPRPTTERALKSELGVIVSLITRLRTPFCVLCGDSNWHRLEAGHFWHRAMPPTEFDLDNLSTLCRRCNHKHESEPGPYRDYLLEKLGERGFDDLAWQAHQQTKIGYVQLLELHNEMTALLDEERAKVA